MTAVALDRGRRGAPAAERTLLSAGGTINAAWSLLEGQVDLGKELIDCHAVDFWTEHVAL